MQTRLPILAVAVIVLAIGYPAEAKPLKKGGAFSLTTAALSLNPNSTDSLLCIASNTSTTATISVDVELIDGQGLSSGPTTHVLAPGSSESIVGPFSINFWSYCRITPDNPADLPSLRGSHCIVDGDQSARTCSEAR